MNIFSKNIENILISGGIGVIPTDTIYGLVGRAEVAGTVERIYKLRKRRTNKPCIVLISSYDDTLKLGVEISPLVKDFIDRHCIWPGKVSVEFSSTDSHFYHLNRGQGHFALRMPDSGELRDLISRTGPLIAPSANKEGEKPATTILLAQAYFGDLVDFYVDGGELDSIPSTLIKFENDKIIVLRKGAVTIV